MAIMVTLRADERLIKADTRTASSQGMSWVTVQDVFVDKLGENVIGRRLFVILNIHVCNQGILKQLIIKRIRFSW